MRSGLEPSVVVVLENDRSENGEAEEAGGEGKSGVVGSDLEVLGNAFTARCDPGEAVVVISDTDDRDVSE